MTDKPVGSVRERLKEDLEARYDKLLAMLDEGMVATRKVRVSRECNKCGCSHFEFVEVTDFRTAREIAEFFANQGFGRPAQASDDERKESFEFVNKIFLVDDHGEQTLDWLDARGLLAKSCPEVEAEWALAHPHPLATVARPNGDEKDEAA